ncbi:MAG: glycosyltransferase family 1 protein [Candidatus Moranbacteria bacterium]|nr:glycosyltransferase family 1 protein [Candidatus Moranbacteria bacterium]
MKIGIDIRNIGKKRTGDEVVFFNLVKNLTFINSRNEYFLFTDITDTVVLRNMVMKPLGIENRSNFKIVSLKAANKFIWNSWTLPRYLRRHPVDVYHTQYITPFFVPKKIKIITTIHDISFNFFPQLIKFSDLFFLKILIPLSLKRANKIIAVSHFTKDEIVKYYKINPEKIETVHNSVDDDFLRNDPSPEELEKVRKKYSLPAKFMLYIGTMQPRKNLPFLIKGYSEIKHKLPDIKLVIAGNREARNFDAKIDEVLKKCDNKQDVIFPGFIDEKDKPALFQLAHLFVFPSLYEGFGIPVLEAMSRNVPVLVSDIPSAREVAGESAFYFNPFDLDDFSKKLYDVSVDERLRAELRTKGAKRFRDFSWKDAALNVLKIYQKLAS